MVKTRCIMVVVPKVCPAHMEINRSFAIKILYQVEIMSTDAKQIRGVGRVQD
jgi:hypothetical protein